MPARNFQNPIRKTTIFDTKFNKSDSGQNLNAQTTGIVGICSACKTEIPSKPGFRPSSLKCPKCNKPVYEK